MKLFFSLPDSGTLPLIAGASGGHETATLLRGCEWGLRGWRKTFHHVREGIRALWHARDSDVLILCTAGIEVFICALLRPILAPETRLVIFDFLIPKPGPVSRLLGSRLVQIDAFAVIRSGDTSTLLRRFGVRDARCHFIPFPAPQATPIPAEEGDYVYSAGWAHRDWETLLAALAPLPVRAVLSAGVPLTVPENARATFEFLPMQTPEAGRTLAAAARLVVLPMRETELPSGPLVLLDAMAMGKAIVATRVNGTQDYLREGETGLLVPPGDVTALSEAVASLFFDAPRRRRLGLAARREVSKRFRAADWLPRLVALCTSLPAAVPETAAPLSAS